VGERTTDIHPTAVVHPGAQIGPGVRVGPFAVVGAGVGVGEDAEIGPHAVLEGPLEIGARCQIHVGAVIGLPPQDLKWKPGTPSGVRIGEGTVVREYSTIHRATTPDGWTVLGRDCYLMAQGHIAHDCQIGDRVIMTGYTVLTGFVQVGDRAVISGLTGIHQFVRIGTLAMVSGCSRISQDVPPYFIVEGNPAEARGVNIVGLRRAGVAADVRLNLQRAYKILYRSGRARGSALEQIRAEVEPSPEIEHLCHFIASTKRGIC
jgi:UDP-N-acetylglucosamine acyltransferase